MVGHRWWTPLLLRVVALGAWWGFFTPAEPETPRNVILISIDTLRADHLGAYGYARDTSPALDAFARRSTRFEHAITHGESTLPGHGAMLSSRHYGSYGRTRLPAGPPADVDMLAETLKGNGFATWGFVDGGFMRRAFRFDQGFDHYEDQRIVRGGPDDAFAGHVAFAESSLPGVGWRTVVSRTHQLLYDVSDERKPLYDLERHPKQQIDSAASAPEIVASLMAVLEERLAENARRNRAHHDEPPLVDAETKGQLEALGYLGD